MAVQTAMTSETTEPYILGIKLPNISKAIFHSVTKSTFTDVSNVLNNTATGNNNEIEISSLAPSEETFETEELYNVHEEPDNEKIKITS
jgi:hypothetical protein